MKKFLSRKMNAIPPSIKHTALAMCLGGGLMTQAYASGPGLYLGLMGGPASNNGSNQTAQVLDSASTISVKPQSSQFAGRIFTGYQFNQYVAWELGYTVFSTVNYKNYGVTTMSRPQARVRSLDILGKGIIPIVSGFDIFAKLGMNLASQSSSAALNPTGTTERGSSKSETNFRPVFGIGGSAELNQNWIADLSWSRVLVGGPVKSFNFLAVGISYHFVDKYCGQFLCDD